MTITRGEPLDVGPPGGARSDPEWSVRGAAVAAEGAPGAEDGHVDEDDGDPDDDDRPGSVSWAVLMLADVIAPITMEPRARMACCQEV
jgi:hypothetical protein